MMPFYYQQFPCWRNNQYNMPPMAPQMPVQMPAQMPEVMPQANINAPMLMQPLYICTPVLSDNDVIADVESPENKDEPDNTNEPVESPVSGKRQEAITTNPAPRIATILLKELTGYSNYGNPSGNADILYTGNRGTWTFDLPSWLPAPSSLRGELLISAVLDDHAATPANRYSARITMNRRDIHNGDLGLVHGEPQGRRFRNWRLLTFRVPDLRRNNRLTIVNTSNANDDDWIGLDWMELRLFYV